MVNGEVSEPKQKSDVSVAQAKRHPVADQKDENRETVHDGMRNA
jgi:hypothetical protein